MKALLVLGVGLLVSLGVWQLQRLEWKRELIARVEQRAYAPPVPAPTPARFAASSHEYQRVALRGQFLHDRETLVQAVTRLGGGFWVLTPLRSDAGFTVIVNRGFVETGRKSLRDWYRPEGEVAIVGLVRLSEPGGGFLRDNVPGEERWYSRDVSAIGAARGLATVAPYFVDAAEDPAAAKGPVGGLTVLKFNDNHLQYALTWFVLAGMLAAGSLRILRR